MEKLAKQLEKKLDLANVLKIKEKTENELSHRLKYCTFCKIVSPDEHNQIIFQNELLVIFDDIKKIKNVNHLLAVPKNHIKDINKAGFLKISDSRKCSTCSVMLHDSSKLRFDPSLTSEWSNRTFESKVLIHISSDPDPLLLHLP